MKQLRVAFLAIMLLALGWRVVEHLFGEQTRLVVRVVLLVTASGLTFVLIGLLAKKVRRNR